MRPPRGGDQRVMTQARGNGVKAASVAQCVLAWAALVALPRRAHAQSDAGESQARASDASASRADASVAAAAEEGDVVETGHVEGPRGTERVALWWQPVSTLFWAFRGQFGLSLGTQIPLAEQTELVIDGFFNFGGSADTQMPSMPIRENLVGWQGSVGLLRLFGPWRQSGPFVQPKVVYAIRNVHESPSHTQLSPFPDNIEGELGLGLDIGWQFASGPVIVAVLLGGSLDWCFDCISYPVTGVDMTGATTHGRVRAGYLLPAANLNLFRVGLLF